MRYVTFFILTLFLFSGIAVSQNKPASDTDTTSALQELVNIRKLQQESIDLQRAAEIQREQDIAEWKKNAGQNNAPKSEAGVIARIESNTRQEPMKDGWNLYGWIAFIVATFSAIIALITFRAQSKTEQHTKNAPLSAQIGRFKDLTRHLYRNLVCTSAAIAKYNSESNYENVLVAKSTTKTQITKKKEDEATLGEEKVRISYPSESNFNKLKTMPDDVILNIDVNERTYSKMHELKVLLRNYNIEIDVASSHSSKKQIWGEAIEQDFDNLLFKPLHLIKSAFESEELMLSTESGNLPLPDRSVYIILEEHFKKLKDNFKALGYIDSFELLKGFFGEMPVETETDAYVKAIIKQVKQYYQSNIDITKALNRAIDGFIKEAKRFNSSLIDSENDTLKVTKESFCEYLDQRDSQILKDIEARLKENKKLLRTKNRSLLWPFDYQRKKDEISLVKTSIERLEAKLKVEKEIQAPDDDSRKLSYFVKQVSKADELKVFLDSKFIKYNENDKPHVSAEDLHKQLIPYIRYISQKEWSFRDMVYIALAIDATIEIGRIGMVNYA